MIQIMGIETLDTQAAGDGFVTKFRCMWIMAQAMNRAVLTSSGVCSVEGPAMLYSAAMLHAVCDACDATRWECDESTLSLGGLCKYA